MKNILLAGASSHTALALAKIIQAQGGNAIGISRGDCRAHYSTFYQVDSYKSESLPAISDSIDGLVYFPGTINLKPFQRLTAQDFAQDLEVNLLGAVASVQKYLANLKLADHASVVFISSVAATTGMPFHASVAMAKAGLEGLAKALAAELAPKIRVNVVAPSLMQTPLAQKFLNTEDKIALSSTRNPMKKIGSPEDLANAIHFLLSDTSGWITGQTLAVDGGMCNIKN